MRGAQRDRDGFPAHESAAGDKTGLVVDSPKSGHLKEGINQNLYYRWSKEFLEAGKRRLAGDTAREATSEEVKALRAEVSQLKEMLAELMMENRLLKKSVLGVGEDAI
jgi:hypothetical protein